MKYKSLVTQKTIATKRFEDANGVTIYIDQRDDSYNIVVTDILVSPADARALAADILAAADEVEGVERKSESDYARRRAAIILGQVRP